VENRPVEKRWGGPRRECCIRHRYGQIVDGEDANGDFPDAERLVKRSVAQELNLSFVPDTEDTEQRL
jgi:hypothetical protein